MSDRTRIRPVGVAMPPRQARAKQGRTPVIDETHAPGRTSWAGSANGHGTFLIQNLPHGVFSPLGENPRGGIATGEKIFDISMALKEGLFFGMALDAPRPRKAGI